MLQTRLRRDHTKYLVLIEAVALLHQYQRRVQEVEHGGQRLRYIEVTKEDIAIANRLAHEVLGRSLDELPPQTRRLLGLLEPLVAAESVRLKVSRGDFRFSRREVRERTGWGDTQLRVHLGRLLELEYLVVHRGRQGQSFVYELVYASVGASSGSLLAGLVEASALEVTPTSRGERATSRGSAGNFAGGERGESGPSAGGMRGAEKSTERTKNGTIGNSELKPSAKPHPGNGKSAEVVMMPSAAVAARVAVS